MSDEERDEEHDEGRRDGADHLDEGFLPSGGEDGDPEFVDDAGSLSDRSGTGPADPADRSTAPDGVDLDSPLDDLADRARRSRDSAAKEEVMDAFSEVDVGDVDVEHLWNELEDDQIEETVDAPRGSAERDVRVVNKRDYCQRCQYFSAPPEVRCTHAEAEIREMVDTEQFEVVDCPILRGEEELENLRR